MGTVVSDGVGQETPEEVAALCRRFQGGCAEALDKLYRIFDRPLYRWLRFLTRDTQKAADLAQDVWLRVIRKKYSLKDPYKFKAWLYRIAQREVFMIARHPEPRESLPHEALNADEGSLSLLIQEEDRHQVLAALKELPPVAQAVLWLAVVEEYSHREIGQILGIPEGTARSRLHYSLKRLRQAVPGGSQ